MNRLTVVVFALFQMLLSESLFAEPLYWGVTGHPLTQIGYINVPISTQLDLLTDLGVSWYRFDVPSNTLTNMDSLSRFDHLVNESMRRKIRLLPILFSAFSQDKNASAERVQIEAFTYAKKIVSRYKGKVTHWELNNELENYAMIKNGETLRSGKSWHFGVPDGSDPDVYESKRYQIAKAEILGLYRGMKAADANAVAIVNGGWLHYGFIERLVNEDHVPFDVLAWHWYSEMGEMNKIRGNLNLIEILKRYNKPLWVTEISLRNCNHKEMEQAEYITESVAKIGADSNIGAVFLYELFDQPYFGEGNEESHFGLVEMEKNAQGKWQVSRKKLAFEAYKAVVGHLPMKRWIQR